MAQTAFQVGLVDGATLSTISNKILLSHRERSKRIMMTMMLLIVQNLYVHEIPYSSLSRDREFCVGRNKEEKWLLFGIQRRLPSTLSSFAM